MKKKLITAILVLSMAAGIVACGGTGNTDTEKNSENTNTESQMGSENSESEESEEGAVYKIIVVDEANNPVSGVMVQLCKDSCMPKLTDENGIAEFSVEEVTDGYKASIMTNQLPEGYVYEGEAEVYFENGETEVTLVITAEQ